MVCYTGFGDMRTMLIRTGEFTGGGRSELAFLNARDDTWTIGAVLGREFGWRPAGSTGGFGDDINDGRPFWTGRFDGGDRDQLLFYFPGDHNWWLGTDDGTEIVWSGAGNTAGFGNIADGRPVWIGRFSQSERDEVLFYFPGDDNWWLGRYEGGSLQWSGAGNTAGFGHDIDDGRPFWIGRFSQSERDEVLFYFPGDDNWWLARYEGGSLQWSGAGNTAGFGHDIDDGRPFWIADIDGDGCDEVLFYFPGDHNWWLGSYDGSQLAWAGVGNTAGFGNVADGRPFWTGRFSQAEREELVFYFPGDGNWWLGSYDGSQLAWSGVGNTAGFGNVADGRPFWTGRFTQAERDDLLFYFPGDGNWWLGSYDAGVLQWSCPGNTGRPWGECTVTEGRALVGTVRGDGTGLWGEVDGGQGVMGVAHSSAGAGVMGRNLRGGNAGLFEGDVTVTGDLILAGADVAEEFPTTGARSMPEPGAVVVLDEEGSVGLCRSGYDRRVAGIVSGAGDRRPALVLDRGAARSCPVAVVGKAWCWADARHAPIRVGDLLTTGALPGHAMRATDPAAAFGAVLGKALTPLESGTGHVLVLVGLG